MGRLEGKVAYVTGAARGQGREHCVRMAAEGADIIAMDVCDPVAEENKFSAATADDLVETVGLVEAAGRRIVARVGDVRDLSAQVELCADGAAELGGLDIVVANAGISNWGRFWEMPEEQWQTMIDINLTGVWKTLTAAAPIMIENDRGGSIIITSSVAGLKSLPAQAHYSSAKHGVVGLCKSAAIELGPHNIRVNTIHSWGVATAMGEDQTVFAMFDENPSYAASFGSILAEPQVASPSQISDVVIFLASDESALITAAQIPADMGATKV